LRRDDYPAQPCHGLRDGGDHRRRIELHRRSESAPDRAVRHLPGLIMTDTAIAIDVQSINKYFGVGPARVRAVQDVSFQARVGELLYVVGPSGSGKTTMRSIISGILRPDSGAVAIEGTDIWSLSSDALAEFRLHRI